MEQTWQSQFKWVLTQAVGAILKNFYFNQEFVNFEGLWTCSISKLIQMIKKLMRPHHIMGFACQGFPILRPVKK